MTALTYTAEYLQSHAYMAQVFCEEITHQISERT